MAKRRVLRRIRSPSVPEILPEVPTQFTMGDAANVIRSEKLTTKRLENRPGGLAIEARQECQQNYTGQFLSVAKTLMALLLPRIRGSNPSTRIPSTTQYHDRVARYIHTCQSGIKPEQFV